MPSNRLTRRQRKLVRELDQIVDLLRLHYRRVELYTHRRIGGEASSQLARIKRHFVLGDVVNQYTLMDEFLNVRIARYFFGRRRTFFQLWRTKKFQNFNYFVLESLSLMEKLHFVRGIEVIPKPIVADIERLNAVRNGLAHAFFPENLRSRKPKWKGKSIFSYEGLNGFVKDTGQMASFFFKWMRRR